MEWILWRIPTGTNEGNIAVSGADADAVHIDDNTFHEHGHISSLNGNAITAKNKEGQ